MTTFGNWPLLERVTNDEFLKILPHLSLEHYFLTQVFIPKKKWINMVDVNFQTLHVKCIACSKHVRFEDLENHLKHNDHLMSFLRSNAKQFYHPFYTYGKGDMKMARGEPAPQKMREGVLREVNLQMKSFRKECILAKQFANIVQRRSQEVEDDNLIQAAMSKKIENPEDMVVKVTLPFEDIPKLFFCEVSGEWQGLLGFKNLVKKSTFHCNICSMSCCGVESLNSHLNGFTHRLKQLKVLSLRYEDSSKINKNCSIHFGDIFSFSVKKDAKHLQGDKIRNNLDTQITKLPNEIAKKINALDEYVPNELSCTEDIPESCGRNTIERDGKFEYDEHLGHLGVEYVLKIMKNENDRDPRFECGLCEFVGDGNKMQRHLLYYDHKKKYLDLHYSDTVKKYESSLGHMSFRDFRDVMNEIVDKLSIEIEKHHSRSLPYTVKLSDYKTRRPDLIAEAYALLHASQNRGPSFSNVFSIDDIRNLKNAVKEIPERRKYKSIEHMIFTIAPKDKIYLNQMSHDPVVRLREYNTKMNKSRQSHFSRSISPTPDLVNDSVRRAGSRNDRSRIRVHEQRTRSRSPISGGHRSPIRRARGVFESSRALNQNIWDTYRREIAIAANEIESAYENYRKNPESHPLYEEEWNSFWQHRKKELEREGLNHRTYNFQPEWVHYFKQRIEVLFGEALYTSQINIRHRLDIPLDAEEDCQRSHEPVNRFSVDRHDKDRFMATEELDGIQRQHKRRNSSEFKGSATQTKRVFPEQINAETKNYLNVEESPQSIVTRISDNHSNVVHVLRLMTALEEHLGSLGGKVMDLLSNALQMEKSFRGNSIEFEAKVLTIANCQLLETAMEKLKGILFAGLLDEQKISGFNRVIHHTANLLKYAEKMGWRQERHEHAPERNTFHHMAAGVQQEHMNVTRNRGGGGGVTPLAGEKALSDTLIDLVNTIPHQTNKQHMNISTEQFIDPSEHQLSMPPVCPPPPTIKGTNINSILFSGYKEQQTISSGLASFNTKLSLDQTNQTQKHRHHQSLHSEFVQMHRNTKSGGNNLYNNSFKNNNDTRTCVNTRSNNGPKIGGGMNNNSGSATQNKNSQFIPNVGQNNAMYQGGGNSNPNWSRWNNIN
ncbi:uncharacterized protein LOC119599870 isoform X3 [Lucilia sericata]|uniref:uncharacterized protein LOC119599870 isoform X3 n=1 Tax=Lucilia sericata TaxID=13632 RepID=UPI0018A84FF4|nr:uncharacterized protein LOC119599870 isoform X3 [Lucilia sericata]XP_037805714.1 uncharacterized protein LOC119599870 isoform X3 [Lucilia sericata]